MNSASAHASRQRCDSSNNHDDNNSSSYFQSTVCLYDWWLIKSDEIFEGKRLAVAGSTSTGLQARRVFTSSPIVKWYNISTLETADGICIQLNGFMNKSRTKENGFSDEVLSHFLLGFPPCWEEFTTGPGLATIPDTNGSATGHDGMLATKGTVRKSKTQEPASLESLTISNAALEECLIAKASDVENLNSSKKNERHTVVHALKAKRNKMGSANLVSHGTSNLEGMNMFDFCDDELQQPAHDTVVKDNSKQGKDHRKESKARTPRQKPNNSDRSRNVFSDTNHQFESETAVGEREATANGDSSKMKARRNINFDTQASPLTQERKENIVPPESLSLKRSRSGRLLLPSLDFWRNQIAVYDAGRKIIGIQVATPSKGSKSEPPKKRSR